ncbi:CPBP family intramembrane glutamic endopeptidase [Curtobacterium sp. Curtsp57]|uniref:CPBP family intramembrane glutamic endopeptidase n=1 Tax=Curtobacterium sp. Curtsp57 TaxID=3243047 RepID=UPI0039B45026
MQPSPEVQARPRDRVVLVVFVAIVVAVVLERIVGGVARTGGLPSPVAQVLASDLAVWVPLVVGAVVALRRTRAVRSLFRLDLADLVAAIGIVIVCRAVDAAMSLSFFGTTGLTPSPTLGPPSVALLLVAAIGTCIVSPIIEELVFRGILQRRLADALTPRTRFLAVIVTAFVFAIVHVLLGAGVSTLGGFEVFVTTFLLGLLIGTLVAMTGRIGGAILAHAVFNAVAVVATWPR